MGLGTRIQIWSLESSLKSLRKQEKLLENIMSKIGDTKDSKFYAKLRLTQQTIADFEQRLQVLKLKKSMDDVGK